MATSHDWPLSRKEKEIRLVKLFQHELAYSEANNSSFKENLGDNCNVPDVCLPGVIEDGCSALDCSMIAHDGGSALDSSVIMQPNAGYAPRGSMLAHADAGNVLNSSMITHADGGSSALNCSMITHPDGGIAATSPHRSKVVADTARTHSSQDGSSVRSSMYLTPDSAPRTPPGYGSTTPVPPARPASAPTAPDSTVCKQTGTVIPSIPPMPSAALRNKDMNAKLPCLTPPPCPGMTADATLSRRPNSAAAGSASATRARRLSFSEAPQLRADAISHKEIMYPPNVLSAARHGRFAEIEAALSAGFYPGYTDTYGNTIFHIACQNGRKRIAKLALKYGCDVNAQNMKGNTGLHFLFAYGYPDVAMYFVEKGADDAIRNAVGKVAREGIK